MSDRIRTYAYSNAGTTPCERGTEIVATREMYERAQGDA